MIDEKYNERQRKWENKTKKKRKNSKDKFIETIKAYDRRQRQDMLENMVK